jgi:hypothetical protein
MNGCFLYLNINLKEISVEDTLEGEMTFTFLKGIPFVML